MGAQWQNTIVPAPAAGTAHQCGFSALLSKNHHREVVTQWEVREAIENERNLRLYVLIVWKLTCVY